MKALVFDDYGMQPQVREIPVPTPKADQILVRMCAAAVNPFDLKLAAGLMKERIEIKFPFVPGTDGSGIVEAVGDDVDDFVPGDEIYGMFSILGGGGSFAEYGLADVNGRTLAMKPTGIDFTQAAAIPQAGLMAKSLLRAADLFGDERVLIIGAPGGVGSFLVQLCAEAGATVIATAAGSADAEFVQRLGAKEAIDYMSVDLITQLSDTGGVDVIFDLVSQGTELVGPAGILRSGGRLISSITGPDAGSLGRPDVRVKYVQLDPLPGELQDLGRSVADRRLHVEIGAAYTLGTADNAFAAKEQRHSRGKIVVTIP